jgi:CHAT domain-containing protein
VFHRPGQLPLSAAQRQAIAGVVSELAAAGFRGPPLVPRLEEFATLVSQAFVTPEDHALLMDEVRTLTQWHRLPGYWLSWIAQYVALSARSVWLPHACLLFGRSQVGHAAEDLGVDSIERGYAVLLRNEDVYGTESVRRVGGMFRLTLSSVYWTLARTAQPGAYQGVNPVAENPYVAVTWFDLVAALPELPLSGRCTQAQLVDAIKRCSADEDVFGRVVARRHLGYLAAGAGDLEPALRHFETALAEARSCGLDAETGHLLRSLGHAQSGLGRTDEALRTLSDAVRHDTHPMHSYWQAMDLRMLGTVWTNVSQGRSGTAAAEAMQKANEAFRAGRELLQAHARLHQYLPVSRMSALQLARSSADNAVQVAAYLAQSADVIAECELNTPGEALDSLIELAELRSAGLDQAATYLTDREIFRRWFRNGADEDARAYLEALPAEQAARARYAKFRVGVARSQQQYGPASAIRRLLELEAPRVVFMHVMIGDGQLFVAFVANGGLRTSGWIPVHEADLRAAHQRYSAQLPDPELLNRGLGLPKAERALDELLGTYGRLLAPVLEPVLPVLEGRHLKIFPRSFLTTVPLQALPVAGKRLIDICDVSYAQSVELLIRAHEHASALPPAAGPLAMVTGPNVRLYDEEAGRLASSGARIMRDPAVTELADWTSTHPGPILFACHGHYQPEDPAASYLEFGPDGRTSLTALFGRLRLDNAQTVIMGACESALGRAEVSSEFVGLPNVFIAAGARYVVGSLWRVNELATVVLVDRYLQLVATGLGVPESLNQAQRDIATFSRAQVQEWVESALPNHAAKLSKEIARMPEQPYLHPRYWSGFCAQGDL